MRWEDELRAMAAEQCGDPANDDQTHDPTESGV
jgi:hypothetical protein